MSWRNPLFFCALLSANLAVGILKFREKYYAFSSKEAAYNFAKNPEKCVKMIAEKAKESAELIQLLELHQQFESLAPYSQVFNTFILYLFRPLQESFILEKSQIRGNMRELMHSMEKVDTGKFFSLSKCVDIQGR